jgi:FRG domain.
MEEFYIRDEIEYLQKIADIAKNDGLTTDMIFRGQNCDKSLKPKIVRLTPRTEILKTEELILKDFKRYSLPNLGFIPKDDWEWISIAQHHGLPTRLLDWTYNSLIALWFAVKDNLNTKDDGVVYVFHPTQEQYNRVDDEEGPLNISVTTIYRPNYVEKRINAQSGLFTIHKISKDGNVVEFQNHKQFKDKLTKIRIKRINMATIRKSLNIMGINYYTVFPDLDGLSNHLEWRYFKYNDETKKVIMVYRHKKDST